MISIHADSAEDLLELGEAYRGSTAIIGKGFLRKMYIYVWITDKRTDTAYGQWQFACHLTKNDIK